MKRLLIVTDSYMPRWDGVVRFLNEMIPVLKKRYKVTVAAPDFGHLHSKPDYTLFRFPIMDVLLGDYHPAKINYKKLKNIILDSDLVFIQEWGTLGMTAAWIAKQHGKKLIFYSHVIEWKMYPKSVGKIFWKNLAYTLTKIVVRFFYNRCDVIITPSHEVTDILSWQKILPKKRIVHLGVNTDEFKPPKNKREAKEKLGISPDAFVIGYVGRLAHEKNLPTLYRAFTRFSSKHKDAILLIVGDGREDIKKMFSKRDNIILVGSKDDVFKYYQAMDINVLTSLTETTSLTTLEAMSTGLAVLSTPVGFITDYIDDGVNGAIISKKDSYLLARKIEKLYQSRSLLMHISKNARKTIIQRFSWEETSRKILEVIDEASSG